MTEAQIVALLTSLEMRRKAPLSDEEWDYFLKALKKPLKTVEYRELMAELEKFENEPSEES